MSEVELDAVRARYDEPHRRYHTGEHLDEVLAAVDELADLAVDLRAVELAALFHDAIYDPRAEGGGNERASAELARRVVGDEEVARLVLLTATHKVEPGDRNGAVLCDADLWILGSDPERYARYAADVRAEYAHVEDAVWRVGRGAVLRDLLRRPHLFRTTRFHDRLDAAARRNLRSELDGLP